MLKTIVCGFPEKVLVQLVMKLTGGSANPSVAVQILADAEGRADSIKVGDRVLKHTGDYQLEGVVDSVFVTRRGKVRYVVEHEPGFLHIYSEANLRKLSDG